MFFHISIIFNDYRVFPHIDMLYTLVPVLGGLFVCLFIFDVVINEHLSI